MPLENVSIKSEDNSGALIVDEDNELRIICLTSPSTPAPKNLEIFIGREKMNAVQVQKSVLESNLIQLTGSMKISKVNRDLNDMTIKCVSSWSGRDKSTTITKEGIVRLNVFYPPSHIRIETRAVKWNDNLVASCAEGIKGNPSPRFEWKLNGRTLGTGPSIDVKVSKSDNRKILECLAVHTSFKSAAEIKIRTQKAIKVECKFFDF